MKVYEKLGLPYLTEEQYWIIDSLYPPKCDNCVECDENCVKCTHEYLMSDVPVKKVKRWETYNGDFEKAKNEWDEMCKHLGMWCSVCEYHNHSWAHNTAGCFAYWLMQEIEVAEWA